MTAAHVVRRGRRQRDLSWTISQVTAADLLGVLDLAPGQRGGVARTGRPGDRLHVGEHDGRDAVLTEQLAGDLADLERTVAGAALQSSMMITSRPLWVAVRDQPRELLLTSDMLPWAAAERRIVDEPCRLAGGREQPLRGEQREEDDAEHAGAGRRAAGVPEGGVEDDLARARRAPARVPPPRWRGRAARSAASARPAQHRARQRRGRAPPPRPVAIGRACHGRGEGGAEMRLRRRAPTR